MLMKINHILKCVVVAGLGLLFSSAYAEDLLSDDSSVKRHERKVLLQLTDIGLNKRKFDFSVTYCPHKAKKCQSKGIWSYEVDQNLEDAASAILLKRLNGKRYDALKIKSDKISIETIFENIEVESDLKSFQFDVGNGKAFNNSVESYLNENIAPLMLRLLGKAKDARYQEMADKEKETFLATIAKEESVPVKFIEKLMNSAYVFSLRMDDLSGSVGIDQKERKDSKGRKYMVYDASVSVNANMKLVIYNFDPIEGKFKHYSTVNGRSGTTSSSTDFRNFPMKNMTNKSFHSAFKVAAKASGIAANTNLKDDDNFAVFATVDQLNGNKIESRIGDLEDLRIDAPYELYQQQDGKKVLVGWTKARSVASEKTYKEDYGNYSSKFDLIRGEAEISDSMREYPWTGVFWYVGMANSTLTLTEFEGVNATGGGAYTGLHLGTKLDVGYMFNAPSKVEKWLEFNFNMGFSGGEDLETGIGTFENTSTMSFSLDWLQRKYLGSSGLYWGYKYGLGFASLSGSDTLNGENLSVSGLGLNLGLQTGFQRSANGSYYLNVDYMLPLSTKAKYGESDSEIEYEASLSPVLNITLGATFHMRSIGPLAVFMR